MGIGASGPIVMTSANVSMPGGFSLCSQSEIQDLYNNFGSDLNENVVGMEYCQAQIVEGAVNYKLSLVVEVDPNDYWYDHYNIQEEADDQYTVECRYPSYEPDQPTEDCQ